MSNLDLMGKLGSDAAQAAQAVERGQDPYAVMQLAGLCDEGRKAMVDKDDAAIKQLSGLVDGPFANRHSIQACDDQP